jgi:phage shock protein C
VKTLPLTRSALDRVLGGVCGGIGSYLGVSGWWVRVAFIALALTTFGFGLLLYALLWVIIPGQSISEVPPILRPGEAPPPRFARPETTLILGAVAILVGIVVLAQGGAIQGVRSDILAPLTLLLIGFVVLLKHVRGTA